MVYNPLAQPVSKTLTIPLYYTGLTNIAQISEQEGEMRRNMRSTAGTTSKSPSPFQQTDARGW